MRVARVAEADLDELLPLLRGYCDFYEVQPDDADLLALSRVLIGGVGGGPYSEGVQLIARDDDGRAIGFATVFWSWSTLRTGRLAIMNDLFVAPEARGAGAAEALIEACRSEARARDAVWLAWQTGKTNERAQRVYERVGAERAEWIDYGLRP
jgi:GNAT superfamily N-acetyltransferase